MENSPNNLREIRLLKGLSQEQLAAKLSTRKATISRLERGVMQLTHLWMDRLARVLKCKPTDFITDFRYEQRTPDTLGFGEGSRTAPLSITEEVEELLILYNRASPEARERFDLVTKSKGSDIQKASLHIPHDKSPPTQDHMATGVGSGEKTKKKS